VPRDFLLQFFFMNQFPKQAVSNVTKINGYIRSSRCSTGVVDTGGKWKNLQTEKFLLFFWDTSGVVDTGGKFATGVVDTSGKFATGVVDIGGAP
jgi:hypothetical protein